MVRLSAGNPAGKPPENVKGGSKNYIIGLDSLVRTSLHEEKNIHTYILNNWKNSAICFKITFFDENFSKVLLDIFFMKERRQKTDVIYKSFKQSAKNKINEKITRINFKELVSIIFKVIWVAVLGFYKIFVQVVECFMYVTGYFIHFFWRISWLDCLV